MDIKSGTKWPSSALSNFSPHPFMFDGVECSSMEGLLQAFKFDKEPIQVEVCKLVGFQAKKRGSKRNKAWKTKQTLWWKGKAYPRGGDEYQDLLDRAFDALSANTSFQKALLATGEANLDHSIGVRKKADTCLTKSEFCSRLTKVRARLQYEDSHGGEVL